MARILHIEDDEGIRTVVALKLKRAGHTVISRPGPGEAVAMADLWSPHLIITDHDLGPNRQTGLDLARKLKDDGHKVVLLSGSVEIEEEAIADGIPFYLKMRIDLPKILKDMEVGL